MNHDIFNGLWYKYALMKKELFTEKKVALKHVGNS